MYMGKMRLSSGLPICLLGKQGRTYDRRIELVDGMGPRQVLPVGASLPPLNLGMFAGISLRKLGFFSQRFRGSW